MSSGPKSLHATPQELVAKQFENWRLRELANLFAQNKRRVNGSPIDVNEKVFGNKAYDSGRWSQHWWPVL